MCLVRNKKKVNMEKGEEHGSCDEKHMIHTYVNSGM